MPVVVSRGADIHDTVPDRPSLVLATPGAEPEVTGGYAAALLLDSMNMLGRADLRAAEEALRRWIRGASLVRSAGRGGEVVIVAEASVPAVQALVRWDPGGFAAAELDERAVLRFPPVARIAECTGAPADVDDLLHLLALPPGAEVAGPMEVDEGASRVVIRVPRASGSTLAKALRAAAGVRSARRSGGVVRTRIDPVNLA
jgi:primosomal protein N' (replication factor Y)